MKKIVFTAREIERAWRNNYLAYENLKCINTNTHRLMLFYAVECGLKAIIMNREEKQVTDETVTQFSHNINAMLDELIADRSLHLQETIRLKRLPNDRQRNCHPKDINQIWRYGHEDEEIDLDLESKLLRISEWIKTELSGV